MRTSATVLYDADSRNYYDGEYGMDERDEQASGGAMSSTVSRRRLLKAAGVGGAAAWAAPAILSAQPAFASPGSGTGSPCSQATPSGTTIVGCSDPIEYARVPASGACCPGAPDFTGVTTMHGRGPFGNYQTNCLCPGGPNYLFKQNEDFIFRIPFCVGGKGYSGQLTFSWGVDDTVRFYIDGVDTVGSRCTDSNGCRNAANTASVAPGNHVLTGRATNCGGGPHTLGFTVVVA